MALNKDEILEDDLSPDRKTSMRTRFNGKKVVSNEESGNARPKRHNGYQDEEAAN